jgi:hypothetical protein
MQPQDFSKKLWTTHRLLTKIIHEDGVFICPLGFIQAVDFENDTPWDYEDPLN